MMVLTCLSCTHYRPDGCAQGLFWPFPSGVADGVRCVSFCYEPGSDEAEDAQ